MSTPTKKLKRILSAGTPIRFAHRTGRARSWVIFDEKRRRKAMCKSPTIRAIGTVGGGAWLICGECKYVAVVEKMPRVA